VAALELTEAERVSEGSPRATIGVPVFNGESFLAETLDSLLNQASPILRSSFRITLRRTEQNRSAMTILPAIRTSATTEAT
jgi:hypothetical protein